MLLVAITGPVGSGKSSLLKRFCDELDGRVDGFVTLAGERDVAGRGASFYDLEFVASGETMRLATRTDKGYHFNPDALSKAQDWARETTARTLVLDEFGKWEANQKGHWPIWEILREKRPRMVVIAIQERAFEQIETQINRKFDLVLGGNDYDRLLAAYHDLPDWEAVAIGSGVATVAENGPGSWMHSVKFPFTGMVMPAIQAAVLSRTGERIFDKSRLIWVSLIAAALKSLAPAGARINPMLAISIQGWLFSLASRVLGWNRVGITIGGALMGGWAMLHWFLIQYLILGKELGRGYQKLIEALSPADGFLRTTSLGMAVATLALVNAVVVGITAVLLRGREFKSGSALQPKKSKGISFGRIAFWLPTILIVLMMIGAGRSSSEIAIVAVKAIGLAVLLWALSRRIRPERWFGFLTKRGHWGPGYALRAAMEVFTGNSSRPSDRA